jgi:regulator of sigma E protease
MFWFFSLIAFLFLLLIVIGLHELGHFIVARWFGIKVRRFSLGLGKPIYCYKSNTGTEYVIGRLPLGGYVKLLDERNGPVEAHQRPYAFNRQPIYQRFLVVLAGPMVNLLLAIIIFYGVFLAGLPVSKPVVISTIPQSPAMQAGFVRSGEIIKINDVRTQSWTQVIMQLIRHYGGDGALVLTVKEENVIKAYDIPLATWTMNMLHPDPLRDLGLIPSGKEKTARQYDWLSSAPASIAETRDFFTFNVIVFAKLLSGKISLDSFLGPIGIFQAAGLAFQQGLIIYFYFLAILNVTLAFINLLPIPGLDGSQLFYLLLEKIRKKPISIAWEVLLYRFGVIAFCLVLVHVLLSDLKRTMIPAPVSIERSAVQSPQTLSSPNKSN